MSGDARDWVRTHGPQLLEVIMSGSGLPPYKALQELAALATGYPASNPPKWCDTGCKHSGPDNDCALLMRWAEGAIDTMPRCQDWMNLQEWDNRTGTPLSPILCDCPDFEEEA